MAKEMKSKNLVDMLAKVPEEILKTIRSYAKKNAPLDIGYIDHMKLLDAIPFSEEQLLKARGYANNAANRSKKKTSNQRAEAYEILASYFHNRIATERASKKN